MSTCVYRSSPVSAMAGRMSRIWASQFVVTVCVCVFGSAQLRCEMCTIDHKFTWHVTHFSNISPGEQHPGIRRFVVYWRRRHRRCRRQRHRATHCQQGVTWRARRKKSRREKRPTCVQQPNTEIDRENTPASRCGKLITKLINFVCRLRFICECVCVCGKNGSSARHILQSRPHPDDVVLSNLSRFHPLLLQRFFVFFLLFWLRKIEYLHDSAAATANWCYAPALLPLLRLPLYVHFVYSKINRSKFI